MTTNRHIQPLRAFAPLSALLCLVSLACHSPTTADEHFRDDVVPVLESRCAAAVCHGVTPDGRQAGENLGDDGYLFHTDDRGRITDWKQARDETLRFANTVEDPDFSSLIRKPMPAAYGGIAHDGGDNFIAPDDPALQPLRDWIELASNGGEDPDPPTLTDHQEFFADEVRPHLIGRGCATSSCHGETSFNGWKLDPGIPGDDGRRFSVEMIRDNYQATRPFLALDGEPGESRLLKKALPLADGGITHRGGNRTFFTGTDDPAARAIEKWATVERNAHFDDNPELDDPDEDSLAGIIYIRGPVQPASPFELPAYTPGSDLYLRSPATPDGDDHNLTAHLHDGGADIRDPAVCHDGRRVAFSMRTGADQAYALYKLDLTTGDARQLTDTEHQDLMATWGPDGELYFASNRHSRRADRQLAELSIYKLDLDDADGSPQRLTFSVGPELNPRYFDVGPMQGHLAVSHRRQMGQIDETVGFEFPLDFGADYHIYFGTTADADHFLVFEEMPDGRALTIPGDPDNQWSAGRLGLIDRNLGAEPAPDSSADDAAVPAQVENLRVLDPSVRPTGVSWGGAYRDPAPLPDGSLLVAHTPGPIDLTDDDATPRFRIRHLTIAEAASGCTTIDCLPRIASTDTWIEPTGDNDSVHSPRPVVRRVTTGPDGPALDPDEPTTFDIADAPVHQGILENPFTSGPKHFRDDARYLRIIEPAPSGPDTDSLTPADHPPARILTEVELKPDHSAFVDIPAETPFRTQLLDDNRMAVGEQHNRWIFAWAGQNFPASIDRHHYDRACGGCHGARSGQPASIFDPGDVTTAASATMAAFDDRNPRRPKDPTPIEENPQPVTYLDDVRPILDHRCSGCHGDQTDSAGGFTVDYERMVGNSGADGDNPTYVDAANTRARTSVVIAVAAGEPLDVDRPLNDHPDTGVTDDELLTLIRWVETGAAYDSPDKWNDDQEEHR